MERLGLWGEGTAFKSFEQLYETVRKKGLGECYQQCCIGPVTVVMCVVQTILVNCISSMRKNFMQLSNIYAIISTSDLVCLIVMYVGTSELHFFSPP